MNSKLCKRLRRIAEAKTIGQPRRGYMIVDGRSRRYQGSRVAVNHPETTRGFYRALKAAVRQERAA